MKLLQARNKQQHVSLPAKFQWGQVPCACLPTCLSRVCTIHTICNTSSINSALSVQQGTFPRNCTKDSADKEEGTDKGSVLLRETREQRCRGEGALARNGRSASGPEQPGRGLAHHQHIPSGIGRCPSAGNPETTSMSVPPESTCRKLRAPATLPRLRRLSAQHSACTPTAPGRSLSVETSARGRKAALLRPKSGFSEFPEQLLFSESSGEETISPPPPPIRAKIYTTRAHNFPRAILTCAFFIRKESAAIQPQQRRANSV